MIMKIKANTIFNKTVFSEEIIVNDGNIVHISGDVGSGKTTFLNMVYCLLTGKYTDSNYVVESILDVLFIPSSSEIDYNEEMQNKVIVLESSANSLPIAFLKIAREKNLTVFFSTNLINYKFKESIEIKLV